MKFSYSHYYDKITPKKIKKIADALLSASIFIGSSTMIANHQVIGAIILGVGAISKFLSDFFEGDENANIQ